ncbi:MULTISPECIES: hypothetical protein [unclassified Mesorhizobium]|uniref:hypothetical protein n=1 Tax=unclassified Mesorhizobium TaxID=325217 RepID=UPI000FD8FF7F|nr:MULTISPECIES: hypothetical protein [unclassified Mesorhizobium]TGQ12501.1 hypothetical protein EN862_016665 [Mesorhizobium sp. M2E.F.Ca.ET.219.01.1.1]TGS09453.1 hypothetical protein EN852_030760 [Mesorhizobium sp. M2E.F.Ca.ET.209.01.1.1]TGT68325.1 hypothetical protein EN809_027940 [Mesorhizobium sp. M2E.F.Ca.ET.166.01.1.1]TGW01326.1 hypothetical protein EN797_013250 [Mesorhizobium sp. M2E.F.Ca.ET.154.01.1.1]
MIPFLNPQRIYRPMRTIKEMVTDAGLLGNLAVCLDPGDKNSWPGSGQTVFDVSSNGRNFTLGTSTSVGVDDPTFNGIAGSESSSEYFSSDGGDGFQKATANDTFMNSLHKVGFNWTIISIEFFSASYGAAFTTRSRAVNANHDTGLSTYTAAGQPWFRMSNGSASISTALFTASTPIASNLMLMIGVGGKYNSNTNRDFSAYVNGTFQIQNFTDSFVPTASDGSTQAKFGLTSDNSLFMGSGRRVHGFLMFNKMLSQVEFDALRASFQRRWPTI